LETALREAEEEVGLEPRHVQILTDLPVIETIATGFQIAPFLGRLNGAPPTWRRQETEIEEILEVRLNDLERPEAHAVESWHLPGWPEAREIPFYWIGPYKLWGATYRIVGSIREYLAAHDV
jgi:8-oxo-dGTP pyrophosphatase MutT (NUDIX family)